MTRSSWERWEQQNLDHLGLRLEAIQQAIRGSQGPHDSQLPAWADYEQSLEAADRVALSMERPPRTLTLAESFSLTPFELSIVLLCAGWELNSGELAKWLGQGPTLGSAMACLPAAHWSACTPQSPLRAWRLIELTGTGPILNAPARIAEPVLHFLKGTRGLATSLARISRPIQAPSALPAKAQDQVEQAARMGGFGVIQVVGDRWMLEAAASHLARELGTEARLIRSDALPQQPDQFDEVRQCLGRDTRLGTLLPVFLVDRSPPPDSLATLRASIDDPGQQAIVGTSEPIDLEWPGIRTLHLEAPTHSEVVARWTELLPDPSAVSPRWLGQLAMQFRLTPREMEAARDLWLERDSAEDADSLWKTCIHVARPSLAGLAQEMPEGMGLEHIVLPPSHGDLLHSILAQVRQRATVNVEWGMQVDGRQRAGIAVLFSGASGTGKSVAACALGHELGLPVFRVDLSSVVSKYIGETEKHLSRLFDAAEAGGSVLLFDEADALFGKRSSVSSAHDRHANIEVSYLLQRIETYSGLAILTTNHRAHIDDAFLRRMRFVVQFPAPGASQRAQLWRKAFPESVPVEHLDYERLAEIEMTGGTIRNAALVSASLAAERGDPVQMEIVLRAVQIELGKEQRTLHMPMSSPG